MALQTAKDLRQKRANLWNQANEIINRASEEKRDRTAEENKQIDRLHDEMDTLLREAERLERHDEMQRQLEEPQGRAGGHQQGPPQEPGSFEDENPEDVENVVNRDLRNWLLNEGEMQPKRFSLRNLFLPNQEARSIIAAAREERALGTSPGSAGGHTVPQGFHRVLETALLHYGGMRQARTTILRTATGNDLPMPTSDDTSNEGIIIAENPTEKVSEKDLTFDQVVLRAHMYSSQAIRVSYQLLQDSAFDLASYIAERLGERIGRITNRHFTVGTGSGQPMGIITAAPVGHTAAAATALSDLELTELEHAVDIAYRGRAEWMFHDQTLKALKQLRDGNDRPLWLPGIALREPDTIAGKRYVINNHMPQIGAGNKSILFGDFSKYHIRDVMDILLVRLDEVYAEMAQVGFLAFSRHDGNLVDAGTHPIKALQHPSE